MLSLRLVWFLLATVNCYSLACTSAVEEVSKNCLLAYEHEKPAVMFTPRSCLEDHFAAKGKLNSGDLLAFVKLSGWISFYFENLD